MCDQGQSLAVSTKGVELELEPKQVWMAGAGVKYF